MRETTCVTTSEAVRIQIIFPQFYRKRNRAFKRISEFFQGTL